MDALVAQVDLDGTIADYDGALNRELKLMASPGEPELIWSREDEPPWLEARRRSIALRPGFWEELEPLPVGFEVYRMLLALGFEVNILTKGPSSKSDAWAEKLRWCRKHVPEAKVTITEDKSNSYGRVLVDDWSSYYVPWLKHRPRGLVVIPHQTWNADFKHPQCVRASTDPADMAHVRDCLISVMQRKHGQPLILPERRAL